MPIYDTFSRRKRRAEGHEPDVYQYDYVPRELRTQVVLILRAALGPMQISRGYGFDLNKNWPRIQNTLCREWGLFYLSDGQVDPEKDCLGAVLDLSDADRWLDLVELCFLFIHRMRGRPRVERERQGIVQQPDDAIEELNFRFREAGFGYQFEAGQMVRVDSHYLHAEVVKPALVLLGDPLFRGAQDEFLSAHGHYRIGEYEDAIVDANRAFESTMKAICEVNGWNHDGRARASDLIKIIRANRLLPAYLDQSFDQLIATLKSGLPQVRNNAGGHGQGAEPRATPHYIAGYALHLTAANIVLLVEALRAGE